MPEAACSKRKGQSLCLEPSKPMGSQGPLSRPALSGRIFSHQSARTPAGLCTTQPILPAAVGLRPPCHMHLPATALPTSHCPAARLSSPPAPRAVFPGMLRPLGTEIRNVPSGSAVRYARNHFHKGTFR